MRCSSYAQFDTNMIKCVLINIHTTFYSLIIFEQCFHLEECAWGGIWREFSPLRHFRVESLSVRRLTALTSINALHTSVRDARDNTYSACQIQRRSPPPAPPPAPPAPPPPSGRPARHRGSSPASPPSRSSPPTTEACPPRTSGSRWAAEIKWRRVHCVVVVVVVVVWGLQRNLESRGGRLRSLQQREASFLDHGVGELQLGGGSGEHDLLHGVAGQEADHLHGPEGGRGKRSKVMRCLKEKRNQGQRSWSFLKY